jgi:hypothetical protein
VRLVYEGAGLTLVPGPGAGEIEVRVGGGAPRRVALDGRPVQLVGGLGRSRHAVVLTAVSGEVGVDGFIVQQPWRPPLWLAVGTIGALAAAIIFLRVRR